MGLIWVYFFILIFLLTPAGKGFSGWREAGAAPSAFVGRLPGSGVGPDVARSPSNDLPPNQTLDATPSSAATGGRALAKRGGLRASEVDWTTAFECVCNTR